MSENPTFSNEKYDFLTKFNRLVLKKKVKIILVDLARCFMLGFSLVGFIAILSCVQRVSGIWTARESGFQSFSYQTWEVSENWIKPGF